MTGAAIKNEVELLTRINANIWVSNVSARYGSAVGLNLPGLSSPSQVMVDIRLASRPPRTVWATACDPCFLNLETRKDSYSIPRAVLSTFS